VWDIVDDIIDSGMRYSLLTNGTLVTDKVPGLFEVGKRRTRLDVVQVSLDGSRAEIHDKSRGKGSFDRAVKGLRRLKSAGLPVTSRITLNRHNVDDLTDLCRLLLDDIGLESVGTNEAMPMGAGCFNRDTIALTAGQRLKAMRDLEALAVKYGGRITAMAGPLANRRMYRDMAHARATGEKPAGWEMGRLTACGCVFSSLAVRHDGTIVPCSMLSGMELGSINTDALEKIWKSHPALAALRERRTIPMNQVPGCENCPWAPYCSGGCPGLAFEMTGDVNRANPQDCYQRFLCGDDGQV
jgi:SynChlorMet cassette radical SAM/SPASM protein ScmE